MRRLALRALALILMITACTSDASDTTSPASTVTSSPRAPQTSGSLATTTTRGSKTTTSLATPVESLLVLGDWGSGTEPQGAVAGAMARFAEDNPVEAILTTGDNFYTDNAEFLMHPYDWVSSADIEFWITWGNHDLDTAARIDAVNETFADPPRWTTHRWGRVTIVILDSNQIANQDQIRFLEEAMQGIEGPTVVVFHHPPFSCSTHGDTQAVLENWMPIFDSDVLLVLSGHAHNYQRFEMGDTSFLVTGGGGRRLNELVECPLGHPEMIEGEVIHHFLVLSQDESRLEIEAVDVTGATIDRLAIPLD